jgi:phosphohistidine phosphatase
LKILTLLRHADASQAVGNQSDGDRPLSPGGVATCETLASFLADAPIGAELVLCSTALRAQQTFARLGRGFAVGRVEHADDLYLASDDTLLERLWAIEPEIDRVLLVAHNPGIQILTTRLARGGDQHALQRAARGFPAAGLAELHFEVADWSAVRDGAGALVRFVTPDSL